MKKYSLILIVITCMMSTGSFAQSNCTDGDRDGDGLCDGIDPCPDIYNIDPVDLDKDEVYDDCDNSPLYNPDQADIDGDGIGDVSDDCIDVDRDGICDDVDTCVGIDTDKDGICDSEDEDTCNDIGDRCDDNNDCTTNDRINQDCDCVGKYEDSDEDGVCDAKDKCEGYDDNDPAIDYDQDGIPNACDPDPICSTCTPDDDGRITICNIPSNPYKMYTVKGNCDQMGFYFFDDGSFKNERNKCGPCQCEFIGDTDSDGDGICDKVDECPDNPNLSKEGPCGCNEDTTDFDNDGVCDLLDECPINPLMTKRGDCGCDSQTTDCNEGTSNEEEETPVDQAYCTPSFDRTMEWISNITLSGQTLDNSETPDLQLHQTMIELTKGEQHTLKITPEHLDDICNLSVHVYIDKNKNQSYADDGELLYEARGLELFEAALEVNDLEIGDYRMRVILHFGRILDPCQNLIQGEVEDFLINVLDYTRCEEVYEAFDYSMGDQLDQNADGGIGWNGPWQVNSTSRNSTVIVGGSLNAITSNTTGKLGLVQFQNESYTLVRTLNQPIEINNQLWAEFSYLRTVGTGTIDLSLGDISFGINSAGQFYLQDQTGERVTHGTMYRFELLAEANTNSETLSLKLIIEEKRNNEILQMELSSSIQDISSINQLKISTNSTDPVTPLLHYFDEIKISCDANTRTETEVNRATSRSITKSTTHDIYPNPSSGSFYIDIAQPSATDEYRIIDLKGQSILNEKISSTHTAVDLSHMKSGIYIAQISNAGEVKNEIIYIE